MARQGRNNGDNKGFKPSFGATKVFEGFKPPQVNVMDNYVVKNPPVAAVVKYSEQQVWHKRKQDVNPNSSVKIVEGFQSNRLLPSRNQNNNVKPTTSAISSIQKTARTNNEAKDNKNVRAQQTKGDTTSSEKNKVSSKPDIITYYKTKGMDYFDVRKKCRQYISRRPTEFSPMTEKEKLMGGLIYWDDYTPPNGYTWDDLKDFPIPEDPLPEPPNGPQISPCVIKASKLNLPKRRMPDSPMQSTQQHNDIIQQLESIGADRVNWVEERRKRKEERRKRKNEATDNINGDGETVMLVSFGNHDVKVSPNGEEISEAFPADDDSFIDLCTQTEQEFTKENKSNTGLNSKTLVELQGWITPVSGERRASLRTTSTQRARRTTNTANRKGNSGTLGKLNFSDSTIQSNDGLETLGGALIASKIGSEDTSEDCVDIFESSVVQKCDLKIEMPPRKSPKIKIGDFSDDEDDSLFSQVAMPEEANQTKKTVPANEQSTVVMGSEQDVDTFFNVDDFIEFDRMEEAAVKSKPPQMLTSTPMPNKSNQIISPGLQVSRRSSRISAYVSSAERNAAVVAKETPKVYSKLSRSFGKRK